MVLFRALLAAQLAVVVIYTLFVGAEHGWNLFPAFFGDISAVNWAGQFNLDFMCFLMLSALWVAWRNDFRPEGLGLGVVAFFGGIVFLSIYLLYLGSQTNGDVKEIMLGKARAQS